ncbi:type IV toxin-antitoxin system AbiEi family antitoxin domain-containing protein [Auraticoccus monumenti]|uniref:Transcriptional regulator, AbiEi antitoxin, Type IV TA system n=1 Tax=Auraticoccus monumenti TaxID=675864 RepID=A0A1G6WU53_9ACTN|nr:type IV toxin-antitoxin system AbiEi family antitoxin domain-containing protein [Auraticoccus monumenti]SDD68727.1 Transcriptional regulator, AbiEi antitoxin, Type IV TA system [Auraticoccus monumenti]
MHRRVEPSPPLLQLAALQDGVLSLEQALGHGLGRNSVQRLVGEGRWHRLAPGVLMTTAPPAGFATLCWAGVLLSGDGARIGGAAAAHLHGLLDQPPEQVDVWSQQQVRIARTVWRFRRDQPGTHGRRATAAPPRLSIEDTVIDHANGLSRDDVPAVVLAAVQTRRTTPERLRREVQRRPRLRHRRLLLDLLSEAAEGVHSPLERVYLHEVERAHGLPRGRRQLRGAGGRHRDVGYPEHGLVVELDGRFHEGAGRWRDMERDNVATLSGERTLRYGWFDLTTRPCAAARQVGHMLQLGGWTGLVTPCRRCRRVPLCTSAA